MKARRLCRFGKWIAILPVLTLTLAACATGGESLAQLEQQLEDGGDASAGEGQAAQAEGSSEGGEGEGSGDDGMGPVLIACPQGPIPVKLEVAHTFNYSPNRETDVYSVSASLHPGSWCLLTLAGSSVTAEPCNFSYHYEGFLKGEDLVCQIAGDGRAALEVTGQCLNGQVKLTLSEHGDDEGFSGKMNCPGAPAVDYALAYPLSQTMATFAIQQGGHTVTEREDPDDTGQFSYFKSWTLVFTPDVVGP